MSMVQQTPDGIIIVRAPSGTYMDTIANFQLDFNDTVAALPQGATDRVYEQGVRHAISNNVTIIAGGQQPWAAGDKWIQNVAQGLANQASRNQRALMEAKNAQQIAQASQNDGSSSPQPSVRQESGGAAVSGEGVQSSRQGDWHLAKEKTEELKRRL